MNKIFFYKLYIIYNRYHIIYNNIIFSMSKTTSTQYAPTCPSNVSSMNPSCNVFNNTNNTCELTNSSSIQQKAQEGGGPVDNPICFNSASDCATNISNFKCDNGTLYIVSKST